MMQPTEEIQSAASKRNFQVRFLALRPWQTAKVPREPAPGSVYAYAGSNRMPSAATSASRRSDAQSFGVLNINRGLHLSGVAQFRPMAGAEGSLIIRELRVALFLSRGHVQMVVFMFPMLPGFHLLGGLGRLAGTGRGRMGEASETRPQNHQH